MHTATLDARQITHALGLVASGDVPRLRAAIRAGLDPNTRCEHRHTLLQHSVRDDRWYECCSAKAQTRTPATPRPAPPS